MGFAMRPPVAAILGASLALTGAGCVVFDSSGEIDVVPSGTLYAIGELRMQVNGPFDKARISVAGSGFEATIPANRMVQVPIEGLSDGTYRLVVTALDAPVARTTVRVLVSERLPGLIALAPPPGGVAAGEPFAMEATFSGPAFPTLALASGPRVIGRNGAVPSRASTPTANTVRVETEQPIEVVGPVTVVLSSGPQGSRPTWSLGPWSARTLAATFLSPSGDVVTNGTVDVAARPEALSPTELELWAGDRYLATLVPPAWSFRWDTRVFPEGSYSLTLRARGYAVSPASRTVTIDRTPPRVTSCGPLASPPDDAWIGECVVVAFDEPVADLAPALRVAGVPRPVSFSVAPDARGVRICPAAVLQAELPAAQSVDLGPVTDAAGNPLGPIGCSVALRSWRSACGAEPLSLNGAAARARQVAVAYTASFSLGAPGDSCDVLWLPDGVQDGHVRGATRLGFAFPTPAWALGAAPWTWDTAAIVTDLRLATITAAWAEAAGVYTSDGHNGVYDLPSAHGPPGSASPALSGDGNAVAWSEPTPQGGRALRADFRSPVGFWSVGDGVPTGGPTALAEQPDLSGDSGDGLLLAWLETPAGGGIAQARAAEARAAAWTWSTLGASLNHDPSRSASEPAAWAEGSLRFVAWTEGGSVLVRRVDGAVLPAEVMNADPGRQARSPRFAGSAPGKPLLVFVEAGPGDDEIRTRRWDGAAWVLVPEIANDGAPGPVVRLVTSRSGGLAWIDGASDIRVRATNR